LRSKMVEREAEGRSVQIDIGRLLPDKSSDLESEKTDRGVEFSLDQGFPSRYVGPRNE